MKVKMMFRRFMFYLMTFLNGIFVLPFTGLLSSVMMVGGVVCFVLVMIKYMGLLIGFNLPLSIVIPGIEMYSTAAFMIAIVISILIYIGGRYLYGLNNAYIAWIAKMKNRMVEI